MKKLNLEKNAELVVEIREELSFQYDCNLISYSIYSKYLYIYSRVTKRSLYTYLSPKKKKK